MIGEMKADARRDRERVPFDWQVPGSRDERTLIAILFVVCLVAGLLFRDAVWIYWIPSLAAVALAHLRAPRLAQPQGVGGAIGRGLGDLLVAHLVGTVGYACGALIGMLPGGGA